MGKKKHTRKKETRKLRTKKRKLDKKKKIKKIIERKEGLDELDGNSISSSNDSLPPFVDLQGGDNTSLSDSSSSVDLFNSSNLDSEQINTCHPVNTIDTPSPTLKNVQGYEAAKRRSFSKDPLEIGYLLWREKNMSRKATTLHLERRVNYCKYN